tara:strand:- start:11474 stop:12421 length:948 start_codon:yes stop_codon:yes gene_type:complete
MNDYKSNKNPDYYGDGIDFRRFLSVLFDGKIIILSVTAFVSILGVIYSLALPNIYESKAILVPVNQSSNISGSLGNYRSLIGLTGISLPSSGSEGNSEEAIKKISSLSFFENNILKKIFLPDLMAIKSWDSKNNKITYDDSIYSINTNTWVRNYSFPQRKIPSPQESFEVFRNKHLGLTQDKISGFISISIKHESPFLAKQWTELVINEINKFYREKDKSKSQKAVNYLNEQIAMTNISEVKIAISQLLQEETKKLALIEANEFYVFEYIDPPVVMEQKSEPKRAIICILFAFLGGILSVSFVLVNHYVFKKKSF